MKYEAADFRYGMREAIKEVGQWLTDNADEVVPEIDRMAALTITIDFNPEVDMLLPSIDVDYRYFTGGEARAKFSTRINENP